MKNFFQCLYILSAPFCAFAITLAASSFILLAYHNPVQERISNAVKVHLESHPDLPISLFHGSVFATTKSVAKGEKLDRPFLERLEYHGVGEDPKKVTRYNNQQVVGAVLENNISTGQLVFASDLKKYAGVTHVAEADKEVRTNTLGSFLTFLLTVFLGLLCITVVVSFVIGRIWIIRDAFKVSLVWGISCLILPFAETVYEMKHWTQTKKPFHLKLLALALLGVVLGSAGVFYTRANPLDDLLARMKQVVFCKKRLESGDVFKSEDLYEKLYPESKSAADAISQKSQAVGQTVRYGIENGDIVVFRDFDPSGNPQED